MSDEEKKVETTDTDTSPGTDGSDGGLQLTQEALDQMMGERARRAESAKEKAILEELGLESVTDAKKALKAYREKQQAEMSELEKAQAKLDKLKSERDELANAMREMQVRHVIEARAGAMNFHDPEVAYSLIDRSGIVVEDGEVDGVEDALKALAESKPFLVRKKGAPDIGATETGKRKQADENQSVLKRNAVRWGIPLQD